MWQIILGVGIIFLLMEIFVPSMFFLNFAFAALICATVSYYYQNIIVLIILFCVLSLFFIFALRPIFLAKLYRKNVKTGIEEKYVGKIAKAIENIDKNSGVVSIYDERWQARSSDDSVIEAGCNVEIIGYENLILNVRKVD